MPTNAITPPGAPGIPPRWTSSAKSGVGTAPGRGSRVWFGAALPAHREERCQFQENQRKIRASALGPRQSPFR